MPAPITSGSSACPPITEMELDESSGMTPMARNRTITVLACLPIGVALRSNTPWAQALELHAKTAARQAAKRVCFIVTPSSANVAAERTNTWLTMLTLSQIKLVAKERIIRRRCRAA
jgi:hypothetical protein